MELILAILPHEEEACRRMETKLGSIAKSWRDIPNAGDIA